MPLSYGVPIFRGRNIVSLSRSRGNGDTIEFMLAWRRRDVDGNQ